MATYNSTLWTGRTIADETQRPLIKFEFREFGKPRRKGDYRHVYDAQQLHLSDRTDKNGVIWPLLLCRGENERGRPSTHIIWILWLYGARRAWRGVLAVRVRKDAR